MPRWRQDRKSPRPLELPVAGSSFSTPRWRQCLKSPKPLELDGADSSVCIAEAPTRRRCSRRRWPKSSPWELTLAAVSTVSSSPSGSRLPLRGLCRSEEPPDPEDHVPARISLRVDMRVGNVLETMWVVQQASARSSPSSRLKPRLSLGSSSSSSSSADSVLPNSVSLISPASRNSCAPSRRGGAWKKAPRRSGAIASGSNGRPRPKGSGSGAGRCSLFLLSLMSSWPASASRSSLSSRSWPSSLPPSRLSDSLVVIKGSSGSLVTPVTAPSLAVAVVHFALVLCGAFCGPFLPALVGAARSRTRISAMAADPSGHRVVRHR
mmetsp:Transcript_14208/g.43904  ORF Transcript_14208/g.43904 Transcript_14208/m.43904 type:complete len:322 (-) Transcript_14208:45-1010(-)